MEKNKEALLQNKLFLPGVLVDSRYQILLTPEQIENAKIELHESTLKNYYCSRSVLKSTYQALSLRKCQTVLQAKINCRRQKMMNLRESLT